MVRTNSLTIRAGTSGVSAVIGGAERESSSVGGMSVVIRGGEQATAHMAVAAEEQRALNGNGESKAKAGTNATARACVVREKTADGAVLIAVERHQCPAQGGEHIGASRKGRASPSIVKTATSRTTLEM